MSYQDGFLLSHKTDLLGSPTQITDRRGKQNSDSFLLIDTILFGSAIVVFHRSLASAAPSIALNHRVIFGSAVVRGLRQPRVNTGGFLINIFVTKPSSGDTGFEIRYVRPVVLPPISPPLIKKIGDVRFGDGNVNIVAGDVDRDPTLETAVSISLFTDKRANADDALPSNSQNLRGFWGDSSLGSRLWLLSRSKNVERVQEMAKFYALEALAWMVEDGVCTKITADVTRSGTYSINIKIQVLTVETYTMNFAYNWKLQLLEG